MNLRILMLSEKRPYIVWYVQNVQKRHISIERETTCDCLGPEMHMGIDCKGDWHEGSLWGDGNLDRCDGCTILCVLVALWCLTLHSSMEYVAEDKINCWRMQNKEIRKTASWCALSLCIEVLWPAPTLDFQLYEPIRSLLCIRQPELHAINYTEGKSTHHICHTDGMSQ